MAKSSQSEFNIQTFLRIRPSKRPSGYFGVDILDPDSLFVNLPENFRSEYIDNSKLNHKFHFNGVIGMDATQEEVFKKVGIDAVQNAVEGFNSTIFTYGQTGSGKTFTLTGGPEHYDQRGIIPRAIQMLFTESRKRTDVQFKFFISYLEIYNEQGYDLLAESQGKVALEDLPRVRMLEDEHGNFQLKNLSVNPANSEEEALNLLFEGETTRAIAETPMNMASSRSHCIFTIFMEIREVGSDKVRHAKLNLVDLAGSERIKKTNSSGSILKEAKFINSSLFFLEVVINALYEKATVGRSHIPYRNSMMTSVLRDSLGGNCRTIMVATMNPEASHTDESLSTCRFAQRVSMIKNKASVNEDLDPAAVIRRLKQEILNLREELAFVKGEAGEGEEPTPQEIEELQKQCREYVDSPDVYATLNIGTMTLVRIKDAFAVLKNLVLEARFNAANATSNVNSSHQSVLSASGSSDAKQLSNDAAEEMQKKFEDLRSCLFQRDQEIAVLVTMVKTGKTAKEVEVAMSRSASGATSAVPRGRNAEAKIVTGEFSPGAKNADQRPDSSSSQQQQYREERMVKRHLFGVPPPTDKAVFDDAAASFEWFRERCPLNDAVEENRELLRRKINEAKSEGERANQSRNTITYLKSSIEAIRRERALQQMDRFQGGEGDNALEEETPEEQTHRRAIEQEKTVYKESFDRLRVLKPEIEHIKKILENCRNKLQLQFDQWYASLHARSDLQPSEGHDSYYQQPQPSRESNRSAFSSAESFAKSTATVPFGKSGGNNISSVSSLSSSTATTNRRAVVGLGSDVEDDIAAFQSAKEDILKRRAAQK